MIDVPNLDTVDFDALVEEGRGLIPRYAPEWTDHNLHDPGITLLELLAWLVDQQVYRIGFVSDAHLAAFAALLGVSPRPATPARGLIWPAAGAITADNVLAAGSRAAPRQDPDLGFAVSREIQLCAGELARIEAWHGNRKREVRVEKGAILLGPNTGSIDLSFGEPGLPTGGKTPIALGLGFDGPRPASIGETGAPFAVRYRDGNGAWHRSAPNWIAADSAAEGVLLVDLSAGAGKIGTLRLEPEAAAPRRMLPNRIAINVVPIVQVERLDALDLGISPGWPDLEVDFGGLYSPDEGRYALPAPDDRFAPLIISVGNGKSATPWKAVANFDRSIPTSGHYVVDEGRGVVRFGNGINGQVPPQGSAISRGALDVTRGKKGNMAAGVEWNVAGIGGAFGRNFAPVSGGHDAWSVDDLVSEMVTRARLRRAMLTDDDLRAAARDLVGFGIEAVEVLPRFLPTLPGREVPGARTLLLRPGPDVSQDKDHWLDAIEQALAPRRVLGEQLSIVAVERVSIDVHARLLVGAGSDRPRIDREAKARLRARLSASRDTKAKIDPWPSGRPVTVAEIEGLLAGVDGVIAVPRLSIARSGQATAGDEVPLARVEIAIAGKITLDLRMES